MAVNTMWAWRSLWQCTATSSAYSRKARAETSSHPLVERVVQEEVRQERGNDPALRRPLRPLLQGAVFTLHGSAKPPRDVEPHPWIVGVMCHGALDQRMIQTLKEGFDVQVDDPVGAPASLPRHCDRIDRRSARSIAVRVGMERGFHHRLEDHLHNRLRDAVPHRGDAEGRSE